MSNFENTEKISNTNMQETDKGDIPKISKRPASNVKENDKEPVKKAKRTFTENTIGINDIFISEQFLNTFAIDWQTDRSRDDEAFGLKLFNKPFKICTLQNFIEDEKVIEEIVKEMVNMGWTRRQTDFLELYQTNDLMGTDEPTLITFYSFLKTTVMPWMERISGLKLSHISAACSMYNNGDHLLVHDDRVSDRRIAFVFYLSPWEKVRNWSPEMGGALELFATDKDKNPKYPVVEKIFPKNNQFAFFYVCNKSFHQVGEVITHDYPRLTINGWFHGPSEGSGEVEIEHQNITDIFTSYKDPNNEQIELSEWINECYLQEAIKKDIQQHIEDNSEASLEEFLIPDLFDVMMNELKTNKEFTWSSYGSACEQNYEILNLEDIKGPIKDLVTIFSCNAFFKLLYEYTELDLFGRHVKSPKCYIEIQRWKQECYTMLTNDSGKHKNSLDAILYLNAMDNVGVMTYIAQNGNNEVDNKSIDDAPSESDEEERNDVLLTLYPKNNALNLVYRSEGTARFGKYVYKNFDLNNQFVYILVCSYLE